MPIPLLLVLLLASLDTWADEVQWYQVEVVVFDRADLTQALAKEYWPDRPQWPPYRQALDIRSPESGPEEPGLRGVDTLLQHLNEAHDRLRQAPDYRILAHQAWVLPLIPDAAPVPALVTDPDDPERYQPLIALPPLAETSTSPDAPATPPSTDQEIQIESLPAPEALPPATVLGGAIGLPALETENDEGRPEDGPPGIHLVTTQGPPQRRLFGTVTLRRGRYLHLDVDFLYRPEPERLPEPPRSSEDAPPADQTDTTLQPLPQKPVQDYHTLSGFPLHQSRRIRPNEVHYFDHPLYGVLARIQAIEAPSEEKTSEEEKKETLENATQPAP